jgi:mycothiol synthase
MSTTFAIRPARMDEVEAATELLNRHAHSLYGVEDQAAADLRQYWESPDVDFERDVLVAEGADGSLVGYADLGVHGEHVWLDLRGLEREPMQALLEAIEVKAAEKKPDAGLIGYTAESDHVLRDLYDKAGYQIIRHSYRMEVDLVDGTPEPQWPEGFTVRTMRSGEEERVYEAAMTSFADTWMFAREPFEIWAHWFLKDAAFDPSLWFLAESGDELAGISLTRIPPNEPDFGWVRLLGVIPEFRQRGVAQALLRHTFGEYSRRGIRLVGLGVDAQNPTGAVRVYEKAGMHVARQNLILEKVHG